MSNHDFRGIGINRKYLEVQELTLSNYRCLLIDIPTELFNKLKIEADQALHQNKTMVSGLTGNGVPAHFDLNDNNLQELNTFVMNIVKEYLEANPLYSRSFRSLTNNTPLTCGRPWFNFQKKYEFVPMHIHDGVLSYSAWINIPYDKKDEHTYGQKFAGCFQFSYHTITGNWSSQEIFIDKSFEGKLLIFPSNLPHCVYPFYSSDDYRISMSGNVLFDTYKSRVEDNQ
jgi:hypothetical protein